MSASGCTGLVWPAGRTFADPCSKRIYWCQCFFWFFFVDRYFEFEVLTSGPMRVGWAKVEAKPGYELGQDDCSWAFDGWRVSWLCDSSPVVNGVLAIQQEGSNASWKSIVLTWSRSRLNPIFRALLSTWPPHHVEFVSTNATQSCMMIIIISFHNIINFIYNRNQIAVFFF